ncbi:hypothetical protein LEP1GSC036_0798 [Leptospira weilii str. 2006001853]|uniref:Uncharacterized protein n=1 Tax=Leptospira weilii str. 2006001853 TaxID=1001589 RepID=A0A828Z910_9LEPT|nr:hypothetical protein LEP1GSC036_0798 [Leptospira weilii str. 2006001853]
MRFDDNICIFLSRCAYSNRSYYSNARIEYYDKLISKIRIFL